MKKKVGIITLHRVTNYGSVLQAYALQEKIKEIGYDVQIIDYRPSRAKMSNMLKGLKDKNNLLKKSIIIRTIVRAIMLPSYILRFRTFKKFLNKYLNLTGEYYVEEEDFTNSNNLSFDIYCTGSDQVWNSEWNGKIDKPLFLSFVSDNNKKIAYAASFGKKKLDSWEMEETKKLLDRYDYISVRELDGLNILKELGIKNAKCVLDPTLLLNGDEWRKLSSNKFKKEEYILVYNLNRNKRIHDYAVRLSKKTGCKIKYITYQIHDFYKKGHMYCNTSVENYLSLIDNAKYIVTDSFHGVAFSINFNKNFIVIYPDKFSSRLESILNLTKLTNRVVKKENNELLLDSINYDNVNKSLLEYRNKSIHYLVKSLGDNNE